MSGYRWYFHHGEEGFNIGSLFCAPPYKRVQHIPVTPSILLDAAVEGKWPLNYPDHKLPEKRYDILVTRVLIVLFLGVVVYAAFA